MPGWKSAKEEPDGKVLENEARCFAVLSNATLYTPSDGESRRQKFDRSAELHCVATGLNLPTQCIGRVFFNLLRIYKCIAFGASPSHCTSHLLHAC